MCEDMETFMSKMGVSNFWQYSSIHHIACLFNVCRQTVYNWMDENPGFLDTIKRWEEKRNAIFLEQRQKQGAWIFLAKNWLGMVDEQKIDHSGKVENKLIIEVVNVDGGEDDKN